jgi:hypothetical protein
MWATIIVIVVVFAIIGVGIGVFARTRSKTRWLKQHGTRIIASVTDSLFAAGTGTAKIIIAEWTDHRTQTTYQFRSYVPQTVNVKLGESVDVLIDPDNPERYTVTSVESISMKKR